MNDVHYVRDGEALIPAAETPFARDDVFGYQSSDLKEWVAEKTGGDVAAASVHSISLEDIRGGGPEQVASQLAQCSAGGVCVVNAVSYRDIEVVTLGLLKAERQGRQFLCRTGASYVRVRAGLSEKPLLQSGELSLDSETGVDCGRILRAKIISPTEAPALALQFPGHRSARRFVAQGQGQK